MKNRWTLRQVLPLACVLLISANLRAPFTGLPPVLDMIRVDFGLSTAAAGALTTLPLLAFGLVSPFGARIVRRYGLEATLLVALAGIVLGIALRSAGSVANLYLGTCIVSAGIALGNVLLPSLIKRDFPGRIAAVMSAYGFVMGAVAALASAVAVPMGDAWGWRPALLSFLVFPLAALVAWVLQIRLHTGPAVAPMAAQRDGAVWRSALAWQITVFLGVNSTVYYVLVGWLPSILTDMQISPEQAGSLHGVLQLATAVPGLMLGVVLQRVRDQRIPVLAVCACMVAGLLGLLLAPGWAWVWSALSGFGTGAVFILGMTFIAQRARSAHHAAALAGMANAIGYLLAAVGPVAMGAVHDWLGGWRVPLVLCLVMSLVVTVAGVFAGRDRPARG